nr:helix-hairpin-helix domain-containing protein [Halobacterium sp. R2-5]
MRSSDADDAVEYVRKQFVPVTTNGPEDGTRSAELRANGGVSTSAKAVDVIDTDFVEDATAVSEKALQQLAEAVGTVRHLDFEEAELNEAISALETARDQLSSIADEQGLSTESIRRAIEYVESTLESLQEIRTVKAQADRKLVLIDNGNEVSNSTLTDLLDSIEDAKGVADDLGLGTESLDERQTSLAEQLDDDGSVESKNGANDPVQASGVADSREWEWAGEDEDESDQSPNDSRPASSRTSEGTGASDDLPNDPAREDLIEELHRIESETGKKPTPFFVKKYARYDKQAFLEEFKSWNRISNVVSNDAPDESASSEPAASEATRSTASSSGITTADASSSSGASSEPSRKAVLEDIERVADRLGNSPKLAEYASHGLYTKGEVYAHFDSWEDALDASEAGIPSRKELLAELDRLASELGFPPRESHIDEHGKYASYPYQLKFGSVNAALEEAGLDVESHVRECLADVVASTAGRPTMSDFAEDSPYSANVVYKYWDSWGDALDDIRSVNSEDNSDAESEVIQNELSELYEQVRNLRVLCDAIVDARWDVLDDDNKIGPIDMWVKRLRKYPADTSSDAAAYSVQQRDRNPFSMAEYREKFGTDGRVTEFAETEARRPPAAVRSLLGDIIDGDPDKFYLPVDSQNGARLPVVVESQSELDRAVQMLERLPERPASASANTDPEPGAEDGTETSVSTTSRSSSHTTTAVDSLTEVNGVTEEIAEALIAEGHKSPDDLKDASIDELAAVDSIGRQIALRIKLNVSD